VLSTWGSWQAGGTNIVRGEKEHRISLLQAGYRVTGGGLWNRVDVMREGIKGKNGGTRLGAIRCMGPPQFEKNCFQARTAGGEGTGALKTSGAKFTGFCVT